MDMVICTYKLILIHKMLLIDFLKVFGKERYYFGYCSTYIHHLLTLLLLLPRTRLCHATPSFETLTLTHHDGYH